MARLAFPLWLAAFVVLALAYRVTIPLGEAPDQVSHFAFIEYLNAHKQLPTSEGAAVGEAHQPPLYYLIGALSIAWIPRGVWQSLAKLNGLVLSIFAAAVLAYLVWHTRHWKSGALRSTRSVRNSKRLAIPLGAAP